MYLQQGLSTAVASAAVSAADRPGPAAALPPAAVLSTYAASAAVAAPAPAVAASEPAGAVRSAPSGASASVGAPVAAAAPAPETALRPTSVAPVHRLAGLPAAACVSVLAVAVEIEQPAELAQSLAPPRDAPAVGVPEAVPTPSARPPVEAPQLGTENFPGVSPATQQVGSEEEVELIFQLELLFVVWEGAFLPNSYRLAPWHLSLQNDGAVLRSSLGHGLADLSCFKIEAEPSHPVILAPIFSPQSLFHLQMPLALFSNTCYVPFCRQLQMYRKLLTAQRRTMHQHIGSTRVIAVALWGFNF